MPWKLSVPRKLRSGLYLHHAVADPLQRITELNEENNDFARVIRVGALE